jgi:hypothetical protein
MSHPSYGTPFIDEIHGKDGFSYVGGYPGRPPTGGFSGQAPTPRYDSEDDGDDEDDSAVRTKPVAMLKRWRCPICEVAVLVPRLRCATCRRKGRQKGGWYP